MRSEACNESAKSADVVLGRFNSRKTGMHRYHPSSGDSLQSLRYDDFFSDLTGIDAITAWRGDNGRNSDVPTVRPNPSTRLTGCSMRPGPGNGFTPRSREDLFLRLKKLHGGASSFRE